MFLSAIRKVSKMENGMRVLQGNQKELSFLSFFIPGHLNVTLAWEDSTWA